MGTEPYFQIASRFEIGGRLFQGVPDLEFGEGPQIPTCDSKSELLLTSFYLVIVNPNFGHLAFFPPKMFFYLAADYSDLAD